MFAQNNTICCILFVPFLFVVFLVVREFSRTLSHEKAAISRRESMKSMAFAELQVELEEASHIGSAVGLRRLASSFDLDSTAGRIRTKTVSEDDDATSFQVDVLSLSYQCLCTLTFEI